MKAKTSLAVAELQGLYGPFGFSEKLLQKIWLLGLFETRQAKLTDGTELEVVSPGQWNRLGGPDFLGAQLRIGGREVIGDVEVHFQSVDWKRHGHERDPAYANVVLHVVLFEPADTAAPPLTPAGRPIPQLALLPWLHCSLEEFAADDAIEALAHRHAVHLAEVLLEQPRVDRLARIRAAAETRWKQKIHFADIRLARLGWREACHQTALEILGYRFNRAPMLAVAERFPLHKWEQSPPAPEELWATGAACWQRQGVRPLNQPRRRLAQYADWVRAVPDWPERWREWAETAALSDSVSGEIPVSQLRGEHRFSAWRERLATRVAGGAVSGSRLDTLITNGLLPLLAVRCGLNVFSRWYCWFPGEVPERLLRALRLAQICGRGAAPLHEGAVQGMLQLSLEQPAGFGGSE